MAADGARTNQTRGLGFALRGSDENSTRPLGAASGFDGLRFGFGEPDAQYLGAALFGWERWASGAGHYPTIAATESLCKRVDATDFRGHNKDMNFTAIVTYANGRVDSNNGCRTLAHAESYLKFAASPLIISVQIVNRKGEIIRSAS